MLQIKYDDEFKNLINEPICDYWKVKEDIPDNVIEFITDISNSIVIKTYDNVLYCSRCVNKLDENNICSICGKNYSETINNPKYINIIADINDIRYFPYAIHYYVFDIKGNDVMLYIIKESIYYNNPTTVKPYKTSEIIINKAYKINKNGMYELISNKYYSFDEIDKFIYDDESNNFALDNELNDYIDFKFIYTDNIDMLKNTVYKYSHIWDAKEYLNECEICVGNIVYSPIHLKQFEYLIKHKLYSLALDDSYLLKYENKYKEFFKNSKYLNFMIENNLNNREFNALTMCKKTDMSLIKLISEKLYYIERILEIQKINLVELKKYFDSQNLSNEYLVEYLDYLSIAKKLGLDIKDKKILYPDNLFDAHDKLYTEITILEDPSINKDISKLSSLLELNVYEDDKYIIIPASSIESLVDESTQQQNCVRTYSKRYSNNDVQIYFMRKKEDITKSFVTIEVQNGKIIQARTKFNELPSSDVNLVLKKWEKQIIPVINE